MTQSLDVQSNLGKLDNTINKNDPLSRSYDNYELLNPELVNSKQPLIRQSTFDMESSEAVNDQSSNFMLVNQDDHENELSDAEMINVTLDGHLTRLSLMKDVDK